MKMFIAIIFMTLVCCAYTVKDDTVTSYMTDEEKRQYINDYLNGTGQFADRDIIRAIENESRRTNNTLLQMQIQNQQMMRRLYNRH